MPVPSPWMNPDGICLDPWVETMLDNTVLISVSCEILKKTYLTSQCYKIESRHRVISSIYYMEESVLLGTKPLVDSIRHSIRDPSGVVSVCHSCEWHIAH